MKLTIVTQYYPPEIGAPQARLSELAAYFIRRGHSVTVLTAMPNYPTGRIHSGYGRFLHREQRDGVDVIRTFIYPTQRTDFVRRLANYFSFVFSSALVGSFLLRRTDYLLVESPPLFLGLAGIWLSKLKRARLIFNVSDLWPESAVRLGIVKTQSASYKVSEWLEAFCYRHAWVVTGQSKSILESIIKRYPDCATFLLSNGVDTHRFKPRQENETALLETPNASDFKVLYAGLHGIAQGLDQILDAAKLLRSESGIDFVLVGEGPEKSALIKRALENRLNNVHFYDGRAASEIPMLLRSADVILVVLKTFIPGAVPSKLYEAMATGRPVVLVANGEASDIVRKYDAGIVIDPGDVEGLAQALQTLRSDLSLRRPLGENGRRAAVEHFDRQKIASKFLHFLEAEV